MWEAFRNAPIAPFVAGALIVALGFGLFGRKRKP